jgi:soluble lytic murein transglycosylase-like protein
MKSLLLSFYLGFFMFGLHARTLDAPVLVAQENDENFLVKSKTSEPLAVEERRIASYLAKQMRDISATKARHLSGLIARASRKHEFPSGLILSLIRVESNFQPWAVSPKGALGLMQLMPQTGEWVARRYDMHWDGPVTLLNEEANINMGIRYLAYLRDKYDGNLRRMLSAYNRGPARVDEDVSVGREFTQTYYEKVRQYLPKMIVAYGQRI